MVTPILSRVLAAFASLAILFGAPAASAFGHAGFGAIHAAVSSEAGPVLYAAQVTRLALETRSHSRAPLPTCVAAVGNACVRQEYVPGVRTHDPAGRPVAAAASRGYDATAPPALS